MVNFLNKLLMGVYRFGNFVYYKVKLPIIRHILLICYRILDLLFVRILHNAEFPAPCRIGKGLNLVHGGNGIVIHPEAVIGDNVTIFHQVTIGINYGSKNNNWLAPKISDHVLIGVGAKILGDIQVGKNSRIGANTVVMSDVPDNATVRCSNTQTVFEIPKRLSR